MTFTRTLLAGLAKHLQDGGIGRYIEDDEGTFAPTDTALILKDMPPTPARVIALNTYSPTDEPVVPMGTVMVQIRFRGRPNDALDCDDMADAVFDLLHGASYVPLQPGMPAFSSIRRESAIPMGATSNRQWERADNYVLFGARYTQHRPNNHPPAGGQPTEETP